MSQPALSDVRSRVSPEEWALRVDLAACYRLVALYGWSDLVGPAKFDHPFQRPLTAGTP